MADATLSYIVKVQDRDLKELKSQLRDTGKTAESSAKSHGILSGALGTIAKTAGLAAGAAGIGALVGTLKIGIDEYKESAKVAAQTNAVIKSTGGAANVTAKQVDNLANSILQKTGIDDEATKSGENLLLTFTGIRNEAGKGNDIFTQTTKIMDDMSVSLGQDTKSSAIQLGKALNDPIKGVTALQRVGVSFTQAQRDQIKAMVDSGNTMGAQKLILGELNKEFGGSAEAIGKTLPGQINILKENFRNLAGDIVAKLVPVMLDLVNFINTSVVPAIASVVNYVKQHWPEIKAAIEPIMVDIQNTITTILAIVQTLWQKFGGTIITIVRNDFGAVKTVIQSVAEVIRGVTEIIDGLIHGRWSEVWDGIKAVVKGVFSGVFAILNNAIDNVGAIGALIGKALLHGFEGAMEGLGNGIVGIVKGAINAVIDLIDSFHISVGAVKVLGHTVFPGIDLHPFHIPHLAEGGIVHSPTLALIGEAGPEAVVPLSRGRGAGMGTTINVEVHGNVLTERDLIEAIEIGFAKKAQTGPLAFA